MTNPSKPTPSAPVEVTQADREAAADYVEKGYGDKRLAARMRRGEGSFPQLVQAFARHRLTFAPSGSDLDEGVVVERVKAAIQRQKRGISDPYNAGFDNGLDAAQVVAVQTLKEALRSTPSSTLTPDGDDWLVRQLEAWPTRVDREKTTNIEYLMKAAAKRLRATPAIRDQAFEEAAKLIENGWTQLTGMQRYDGPTTHELPEAIRALKGTS